jgi:GxxExxY protein
MTENEVAKAIVDVAYHVHVRLGPGLLESVYQEVMVYELRKRGLQVLAKGSSSAARNFTSQF